MRVRPGARAEAVAEGNAGRRRGETDALRLLGLARRAGRSVVGTTAVREAGRGGDLALVVMARDATENARARLGPTLLARVPTVTCGSRASLGAALGRGPVAAVGVTDRDLAARVQDMMKTSLDQQEDRS